MEASIYLIGTVSPGLAAGDESFVVGKSSRAWSATSAVHRSEPARLAKFTAPVDAE
jgi:hypothetical protein